MALLQVQGLSGNIFKLAVLSISHLSANSDMNLKFYVEQWRRKKQESKFWDLKRNLRKELWKNGQGKTEDLTHKWNERWWKKQDKRLLGITEIIQKAKTNRKRTQPRLTRKMNKIIKKEVRRSIMWQTSVWETVEVGVRRTQIKEPKKRKLQQIGHWN